MMVIHFEVSYRRSPILHIAVDQDQLPEGVSAFFFGGPSGQMAAESIEQPFESGNIIADTNGEMNAHILLYEVYLCRA